MNYYIRKKDLAVAIEKCETALHFAQTEYDKTYGKIFEDLNIHPKSSFLVSV